ncbi:MAG: hypothetical protein GY809_01105, partial [Planctomycetes bacterium]|nr:hypothetical protein [Planctomycetota bacterium]
TGQTLGHAQVVDTSFVLEATLSGAGSHELVAYAVDAAGNISEAASIEVFVDVTAPAVVSITGLPAGIITTSVDSLTLTLTEAVETTSFDLADITLTLEGSEVNIDTTSLVQISPSVYQLTNLTGLTTPLGHYELTLHLDGLTDLAGNAGHDPFQMAWQHVTATAAIGDRVWNDTYGNGVQDAGEPGVADITVSLYLEDDSLVTSTTTDLEGYYRFEALDPAAR